MRKRNENDKNTKFVMKNNKKMPKKYIKVLSNIFYELATLTRDVTWSKL